MNACFLDLDSARSIALEYAGLAKVIPIDAAASVRAFELGSACEIRLPLVDAFIAAGARQSEATLVHRDPHFNGIPAGLVRIGYRAKAGSMVITGHSSRMACVMIIRSKGSR